MVSNFNLLEETNSSDPITFSSLNGRAGIFRSAFDTNFNFSTFGLTTSTPDKENLDTSKASKLIGKIRSDVRNLGLLCAANDKEKLLNVLIINQQLNIIESAEVEQLHSNENANDRTLKSILVPPVMPQRAKPKTKRNLKVGYGVVTSNEIINEMEMQETAEANHQIFLEENEISKHERETEIDNLNAQLQTLRTEIKMLRSENAAKNKNLPRQARKDDKTAKLERLKIIKNTDDRMQELRKRLNELKSIHVSKNKDVAYIKKQYLEQKQNKNVILPSIHPPQNIEDMTSDEITSTISLMIQKLKVFLIKKLIF